MNNSDNPFQSLRGAYTPRLPSFLKNIHQVNVTHESLPSVSLDIQALFPHTASTSLVRFVEGPTVCSERKKVAVLFSGGQAPGGHNVICGLFDALVAFNPTCELYGFLNGPIGVIHNQYKQLLKEDIDPVRNSGGFDLLGSGRDKIEKEEQLYQALDTCKKLDLDTLVIIGGDDSNTNALVLSEFFSSQQCKTRVIGIPKTIDGDLKNNYIEISFGFDTATKVYSEMISNSLKDAISSKKYSHFIKLMGRSASHIALECALQTRPNIVILGEEVAFYNMTLKQVTNQIADIIEKRALMGKNWNAILIPEGLVENFVDIKLLINELNRLNLDQNNTFKTQLSSEALNTFELLPLFIQESLLKERDPHGNVQVAFIETEKLLIETVKKELTQRAERGSYKGSFKPLSQSFGYEGRAAYPTNFDADYCYTLGYAAAAAVITQINAAICFVKNLKASSDKWQVGALPLASLVHLEERKGKLKPVIKKYLVDLDEKPFKTLKALRESWALEDHYRITGPIQFFGPDEVTLQPPLIL